MNLLILTGAGVSAESGVPTFRDADGLWEGHRVEDVATPGAFARNPTLVHQFYNARRQALVGPKDSPGVGIEPNAAHQALVRLERWHAERFPEHEFLLVTQNIDGLHAAAGSERSIEMHGNLRQAQCLTSGKIMDWEEDLGPDTPHPDAPDDPARRGQLRPHVVWFGEMPIGLERIAAAAARADVFCSIGTSSLVYPAAGIVSQTPRRCLRIEINLNPTAGSGMFEDIRQGLASTEVPRWVRQMTNDPSSY